MSVIETLASMTSWFGLVCGVTAVTVVGLYGIGLSLARSHEFGGMARRVMAAVCPFLLAEVVHRGVVARGGVGGASIDLLWFTVAAGLTFGAVKAVRRATEAAGEPAAVATTMVFGVLVVLPELVSMSASVAFGTMIGCCAGFVVWGVPGLAHLASRDELDAKLDAIVRALTAPPASIDTAASSKVRS